MKALKKIFNFLRLKKSTLFETKEKNKKISDIFLYLLKKMLKNISWILLSYGIFGN